MRRRRVMGQGFEGLELPRAQGLRPAPALSDFQILQGGELPRRLLVEPMPPVPEGPPVQGHGFDRHRIISLLDVPGVSNVGRSVRVGGGSLRSTSILEARCSDERSRQLTIFLSVELLEASNDRDIVGLISWGSGGLQIVDVEVDFINGTAFSIIGSFVRIFARNDSSLPANFFQVGACVGYEPRPAGAAVRGPQRTLKTGAVNVAANRDLTIPRYATSFSIVRTPLTSALTLVYLDGGGNTIGQVPVAAGADVAQNVYPIPGDAFTLRVTPAAVNLDDARVVFGLSL